MIDFKYTNQNPKTESSEIDTSYLFIDKEVDIYHHPEIVSSVPRANSHINHTSVRSTIGDLHGNPIKLLYFLVSEGIIAISPIHYRKLVDLYIEIGAMYIDIDAHYTQHSCLPLIQFDKVLQTHITMGKAPHFFTLLGDIFADRGHNDITMICLFIKLHQLKLDFEIISSNHDGHLIGYYQNGYTLNSNLYYGESTRSILGLHVTREAIRITNQCLDEFFTMVYFPRLKLLSYDLWSAPIKSNVLKAHGIIIYQHTGSSINTLREAAEYLGIPFRIRTPIDFADTAERMNRAFLSKLMNKEIKLDSLYLHDHPLHNFHWFRNKNLASPKTPDELNYPIYFIHGHDNTSFYSWKNSLSLNGSLGKQAHDVISGGYLKLTKSLYVTIKEFRVCRVLDKLSLKMDEEQSFNLKVALIAITYSGILLAHLSVSLWKISKEQLSTLISGITLVTGLLHYQNKTQKIIKAGFGLVDTLFYSPYSIFAVESEDAGQRKPALMKKTISRNDSNDNTPQHIISHRSSFSSNADEENIFSSPDLPLRKRKKYA